MRGNAWSEETEKTDPMSKQLASHCSVRVFRDQTTSLRIIHEACLVLRVGLAGEWLSKGADVLRVDDLRGGRLRTVLSAQEDAPNLFGAERGLDEGDLIVAEFFLSHLEGYVKDERRVEVTVGYSPCRAVDGSESEVGRPSSDWSIGGSWLPPR